MNTLIRASELANRIKQAPQGEPLVVVVDCRFNLADAQAGEAAWRQGHIPGAHYAHLDRDLSGPKTGSNGRHPLPDAQAFEQTLQRWGVTDQTQVVAYDDVGGMMAARLWWMLTHWLGHPHCAVLDGGWQQWVTMGGAVETAPPATGHATTSMTADRVRPEQVIQIAEVAAALGSPDRLQLIDARAPDRFQGLNETLDPVGGHIPGAINRFFKDNLQTDGRFKSPAQLREEFTALLGQQPLASCVHQCGSGVTACHNLLAMDVAGLTGTRLYAGSWSEWCADPSRPTAR
ncbi:MAG: sulfurtransferase [Burkholderiales bacterium]|nr:sulfurtransferase [Burkholderiales bacterium]